MEIVIQMNGTSDVLIPKHWLQFKFDLLFCLFYLGEGAGDGVLPWVMSLGCWSVAHEAHCGGYQNMKNVFNPKQLLGTLDLWRKIINVFGKNVAIAAISIV